MTDVTNNIYVDVSLEKDGDLSLGNNDNIVDIRFVDLKDIGSYNIPVVLTPGVELYNNKDLYTDLYLYSILYVNTIVNDTNIYNNIVKTTNSGIITCDVDFSMLELGPAFLNNPVYLFSPLVVGSGYLDTSIDFKFDGIPFPWYDRTYGYINIKDALKSTALDYISSLTLASLGDTYKNVFVDLGDNTVLSGSKAVVVDLTLSGWVPNFVHFDLITGYTNTTYYNYDIELCTGNVCDLQFDSYCSTISSGTVSVGVYCCLLDLLSISMENTIIPGSVDNINYFCTVGQVINNSINIDISLLSLKIHNFSLGIDEYCSSDSFIYVDVIDDLFTVTISGTYFMVDGLRVPTTYSGISYGYRLFYDPVDDFNSLLGGNVITVHAENSNGDSLEQDYYVTFGYLLNYNNENALDFGYNRRILIRTEAEDVASCPTKEVFSYYFDTENLKSTGLLATIFGGSLIDLPSSIYPDSTAFFYGSEYIVEINASDFAGNVMDPFIFSFKIEDKP